jgi:hypothetical protein
VFHPVWDSLIEPWLLSVKRESTLQSYLDTRSFDGFTAFAEKQGFTNQDLQNLRVLLQLELSFLRSQVWLDTGSLVSEFKLIEHEGLKLYEFRTSRAFKTAGKDAPGSLPAATRWPLSEKQSALVHTLLHVAGDGTRMLPRLTQQAAANTFARLGYNWCGVPRLGPHAMRTHHCWKAVNNASTTVQDHPALACRMQVSLDTMTAVYVAPSLRAPAAQLAFRLRTADEQEQSAYVDQEKEQEQQKKKQRQRLEQKLKQKQKQI